ncbi:suppressor of cytokine signaling 7-like isoform X2 [Periplaneta americana]
MLTTCPNCLHVFHNNNNNHSLQHRIVLQPQQQFTTPLPSSSSTPAVHFTTPCCETNTQPLLVSLQLPPTTVATTCTVSVSTSTGCQQHLNNGFNTSQRVLAGMAGGGIILTNTPNQNTTNNNNVVDNPSSVILQQATQDEKVVIPPCSPQPSPSTPLSFVLPSAPNVFTTTRTSTLLPFQWSMSTTAGSSTVTTAAVQPTQQWNLHSPTSTPWVLSLQMPPAEPVPQVPQSDTDLVRLAATMSALRTSGWYYEGLSWQESAEALQSTSPGTFLVRDSSDPKFLFSLSVQTERGPTSVRLHYVCGQFRLDAEPRLAPLMPLFECVVRLVEYYIEATKDSARTGAYAENNGKGSKGSQLRHKEQVWVDARGHMYSHILLTTPLYKKQQLPSLQHLARLAINKSLKAATPQLSARSPQSSSLPVNQLPLPTPLSDYLKEYPYTH